MTAELDPLALPLAGERLIEASAGTGKTFTIAALFLRLVLGHGGAAAFPRPLAPPEILVLTFTEAATEELRERIRTRLAEAARHFRGTLERPDDFLSRLGADYPEAAWPACARRLEMAAEWMDEAAVSTIHAWCGRMLREHAFDSGSLFAQKLEADNGELRLLAVRDYWRCHCYALSGPALTWVLARWGTPDELAGRLLKEPEGEATDLPPLDRVFAACARRRAEALAALKAPWPGWLPELRALLDAGVAGKQVDGRKLQARHFGPWLEALSAWAADPEAAALDLGKGWQRLSPRGLFEAWKGEPPAHPAFEEIPRLERALAGLPSPERDMLGHASLWVARRFAEEKARRAQLDFDDLLAGLLAALRAAGGERLAAGIRRQFPVALVDEFQDTDPVQYAIFSRVYLGQAGTGLFLIGDPKQAIYGFRNADIHTYLQARRDTEGRHYTLPENFRSTAAMVAAVNRLFGQAEARPEGRGAFLFREGGGANPVPFLPVRARGRAESLVLDGAALPALTLCLPEGQEEPLGRGDYEALMAAAAAAEMVRLLNLGRAGRCGFLGADGRLAPLAPRHLAVLVRSAAQARAVRRELTRRGVRSVYLSDKDSVLASAEAGEVLALLRACAEPEEERPLRAALAGRLTGLPLAELERLNREESAWEARVLQFRGYRRLWQEQGVLPMLRRLMHDFDLPRRLIARPEGERSLTNLLHLSELLQAWSGEVDGEQALIRLYVERMAEDGGAEERILRLESDEGLVQVVTIHKSKGLEYPLAFVPFACHYREVRQDEVVRIHDAGGRRRTVVAPTPEELALADGERLAEETRLLYVALTRARHAAWLGVADTKTGRGKASDLHRSAFGVLLTGGPPLGGCAELGTRLEALRGDGGHLALAPLPAATDERFRADGAETPTHRARRVACRADREPWWVASYSALKLAVGGFPLPEPESALAQKLAEAAPEEGAEGDAEKVGAEVGALHAFPRGAGPGVFLHGVLEWAAGQGFGRLAAEPARISSALARRCGRMGWADWAGPLSEWLADLLAAPLPAGGAAPSLAGLENLQAEMEFWFEARSVNAVRLDALVRAHTLGGAPRPELEPRLLSGMMKGYMDLVFEWQGRYYVADYKSNWLGPTDAHYTAGAMAQAVLEKRYDLQYALYLLALHRQLQARLPRYDYDEHMGGALYLFLRGSRAKGRGVHFERPPRALIEVLDGLFSGGAA